MPSLAHAVPVNEFVDTMFIGGGVMLFVAGVFLLLVPGLFKTGVLITLMADVLFIWRMLFPNLLDQDLASQPDWQPLIASATTGSSRMYAALAVLIIVISTLSLRWLLHSFLGSPQTNNRKKSPAKTTERETSRRASGNKAAKPTSRNKPRLNRDREDLSGYTEEPAPAPPEPVSPAHNKRFRVHDYLENLEHQQPEPAPPKQDPEPVIHFDRIER
ncbi:hypothetical protein [Tolumonas lignilytica]|uniref:hypothetical protein n=1 Tax=Tolumonas lignilytica TaxID=1283284 RepID=UPI00046432B9|nr:hypothetical protein [Tolumonas lignilytica]